MVGLFAPLVTGLGIIGRSLTSLKLSAIGFFAYISGNMLTYFIAFQFISWILTGIFTVILAFYGTDIIGSIMDVTGIQTYVQSLMGSVFSFGTDVDSITASSSFSGNLTQSLQFFNFYNFINLIISVWFGVFALKIQMMVWRATRFTKAIGPATGVTSSLWGNGFNNTVVKGF